MDVLIGLFLDLRAFSHHHPLFTFGVLLLFGYVVGKLVARVGLPEITGFIFAGLLMGSSMLGVVPYEMEHSLKVITEVALGLIALTIGSEFSLSKLRRLGREVVIITIVQVGATFLVVAGGLVAFGMRSDSALLLGAIASATAPAATVAIVQSLRAHGLFVDYLYGIVALDDAGSVILFGVTFALVGSAWGGEGEGTLLLIGHAFREVGLSVLLGVFFGFLLHVLGKRGNDNESMIVSLGLVFITIATAVSFNLSPLLTNMMAGAVMINLSPRNHKTFKLLEPLTPPIYALFFVIAGTELRPDIFFGGPILFYGLIYIALRAVGKYGGVYAGCRMSGLEPRIRNNLGTCMLPQAGVAIGLVLLVQTSPLTASVGPDIAAMIDTMVNIVLLSVFVNEMIGPPLSRYAIVKGIGLEE